MFLFELFFVGFDKLCEIFILVGFEVGEVIIEGEGDGTILIVFKEVAFDDFPEVVEVFVFLQNISPGSHSLII